MYSTRNYTQYLILTYNGQESEKVFTHTYIYIYIYVCI